jgi:hypothetical protein
MKDIIFVGEINRRNIDLNSQRNIDIFSISVSLMTPESQERKKLADKILEICKEYKGEISCPIVFDGSLLIRCRFNCYEAAEAFKYTIKLEYEK